MSNRIIIVKNTSTLGALAETDANKKIFDSQYGTLKYYKAGSIDLVANGADVETSVIHGLGYIPFFIVFHSSPTNPSAYSMTPFAFQDVSFYTFISSYADANKIYFTIHTNSLTATINFKYKIFRNNTGL